MNANPENRARSCAQRCENRLENCLDGNSEGTCQIKYNRCRITCADR